MSNKGAPNLFIFGRQAALRRTDLGIVEKGYCLTRETDASPGKKRLV